MENNIIGFILENIFIYLPLGLGAILITIILCLTGKKSETKEKLEVGNDYINFSKFTINIYFLVYFFIFFMIFLIGLLSNLFIPAVVGGIIALIPIILMIMIRHASNKKKVL
jgi:hypothetical protein